MQQRLVPLPVTSPEFKAKQLEIKFSHCHRELKVCCRRVDQAHIETNMKMFPFQCDTAVGLDELYRKLYNTSSTKIMVLGATTSHVTEATTLASRKWNMTQVPALRGWL